MHLFLRNLLWTILCPGVVTILLPVLLFRLPVPAVFEWWNGAGIMIILAGAAILIRCIFAFAIEGKGTLSPVDPARHLVVHGFYRYTRNPMYVGVMLVLLGEVVFFRSVGMGCYAAVVFLVFNLFIRFYEEPYLRETFGAEYEEYCRKVGRWL